MIIKISTLHKAGFEVEFDEQRGEIAIYPRGGEDCQPLIDLLREEYNLSPMYSRAMLKNLHVYQVLSAIEKG